MSPGVPRYEDLIGLWQDGARRLAENLAEYFVYEKPTVLGAAAFKVFTADLARLQARLEAAEQRSKRLS